MKAKAKTSDRLATKAVMVYYHAANRQVFQGSVWLRNTPGALASASAALARSEVNLVATSASNIPSTDLAEWAFFAEAGEGWPGLKKTQEVLEGCHGVVKSVLKEGDGGMVVDDLHYPLQMVTGEQVMVMSRKTFRDMFDRLRTIYGSGGRAIIYELGLASGIESYTHFARILGSKSLQRRIPDLVSLYTAHGWGRAKNGEYQGHMFSMRPFRGTLKVYDSFECTGISTNTPNSDFLRGHLEGFVQTLTGEKIKCEETKCISMGDVYCQFECHEEIIHPNAPMPWKSEVWASLNSKSS
jgi:predicted hydrocarbon binding protein